MLYGLHQTLSSFPQFIRGHYRDCCLHMRLGEQKAYFILGCLYSYIDYLSDLFWGE
jgi:hypothetical protein